MTSPSKTSDGNDGRGKTEPSAPPASTERAAAANAPIDAVEPAHNVMADVIARHEQISARAKRGR